MIKWRFRKQRRLVSSFFYVNIFFVFTPADVFCVYMYINIIVRTTTSSVDGLRGLRFFFVVNTRGTSVLDFPIASGTTKTTTTTAARARFVRGYTPPPPPNICCFRSRRVYEEEQRWRNNKNRKKDTAPTIFHKRKITLY